MNLNVMKFKNYIWPYNPANIEISVQRSIKEVVIPFRGNKFQDYGREKRVITGSGQFFGENCIDQFDELFFLFKQGGNGYLALPGMAPFLAIFKRLELIASTTEVLNYSFEFWEDLAQTESSSVLYEDYYTVLEGDTLWDISVRFNIPVETLLALNTNIKNPNQLRVGERLRLR